MSWLISELFGHCFTACAIKGISNSYTVVCTQGHGDNPRALADNQGITILYHLHQWLVVSIVNTYVPCVSLSK